MRAWQIGKCRSKWGEETPHKDRSRALVAAEDEFEAQGQDEDKRKLKCNKVLIAGLPESDAETERQEDAVGKWSYGREHQSKPDIHARPNQPREDSKHRDDEKGRSFNQLACVD